MPRKDQGWITFQTSEEERQLLEEICQTSQRTKTEVLRELLRGLRYATSASPEEPELVPLPQTKSARRSRKTTNPPTIPNSQGEVSHPKSLRVSSRNILEGEVKRVVKGPVSTEVTIEIVHRVELTSTITTSSAEVLALAEGKTAYAVIKSSDVVIATE
ncbi:MAG: molybdopterin-binding protein [Leptolyngbyaceae cyanobacterium bins.59]|nr:molybdopterin-binding protein [Leptolyngbyaceae cyanobacterium bins.59]